MTNITWYHMWKRMNEWNLLLIHIYINGIRLLRKIQNATNIDIKFKVLTVKWHNIKKYAKIGKTVTHALMQENNNKYKLTSSGRIADCKSSEYVWVIINMALTPVPRAMKGKIWVVLGLKGIPIKAEAPRPPATVMMTKKTPLSPRPAWDLTELLQQYRTSPVYNICQWKKHY